MRKFWSALLAGAEPFERRRSVSIAIGMGGQMIRTRLSRVPHTPGSE